MGTPTMMRWAVVLLAGAVAAGTAGAAEAQYTTQSFAGPSMIRPSFTRPGGMPGAARTVAAPSQTSVASDQPAKVRVIRKRKRM